MNANSLLSRLEELKKWQERQQERLLQQQIFRAETPTDETPRTVNNDENIDVRNLRGNEPVIVRVENPNKPKQPFLKRGAGLTRYKMTDEDRKKPYGQMIAHKPKQKGRNLFNNKGECEISVKKVASPLKVPGVNIKVDDESKNLKINEESLVKQTITSINELASTKTSYHDFCQLNLKQFISQENKENKKIEIGETLEHNQISEEPSDKTLERELLIFEALEERILNSSFSSTNSSILKILSSTPNKLKNLKLKKSEGNYFKETEIQGNDKTEVSEDQDEECTGSCSSEIFSATDDEASSLNTLCETTATESTLESELEIKDAAKPEQKSNEILTEKLRELDLEIQNFRVENAKLQTKKLEVEKRESSFKKEKREFEKYAMEEKIKLEFYLEDEKKKFAKEKVVFERYVKDVQSKTNRKEREEIAALKDEIANVKEAAKLKETRNATSQARLRNMIKNYEKEISSLKEEMENLRKQNAKLVSSQKYNKRSDTKVLKEINKNLSKLAKDERINDNKPQVSPNENYKFDNYSKFLEGCPDDKEREKIIIESPDTLDRKARELVDENLVRTYEEVFGKNAFESTTLNARNDSTTLNDSKMTKTEMVLLDGTKETKYSNGNTKTISPDGNFITMKYFNGDIKETNLLDGVIKYYYAENKSWHTTFPDGIEIIEFTDGQIETKHKDGTYEIQLPNGIVKVTNVDKSENIQYPDGTKVNIGVDGNKEIVMANGQKEIHTKEHMRREYLDGTVKIVYPDGIQETRYSNGRIRIKDKNGKLLLDSHEENT